METSTTQWIKTIIGGSYWLLQAASLKLVSSEWMISNPTIWLKIILEIINLLTGKLSFSSDIL